MQHRARLLLFLAFFLPSCYAAETDAIAISNNIRARHLPYGTILDPFNSTYTRAGDSALWTGHYVAAEAYRYAVTHAPEALSNVKAALDGLQSLVDATGDDRLARCAFPLSSPYAASIVSEEAHNGIYINQATHQYWVGNTSRDQYSGVFFGLAAAYDLTQDAQVRSQAGALATRLLDQLTAHAWSVFATTFLIRPEQQLALLAIGSHVNRQKFGFPYQTSKLLLAAGTLLPLTLDVQSDSSYFKFNLDYINLFSLMRLDPDAAWLPAYAALRLHTADQQNAFFNTIDRALFGPNRARDYSTAVMLNQWLQRPNRDYLVDLHGKVPECRGEACSPVPVAMRPPADFLWQRDPYLLSAGDKGEIESAGIDYILPYWMDRYYAMSSRRTPR